MNWASFLAGALTLANTIVAWFRSRAQRQAGAAAQVIVQQEQTIDAVQAGHDARSAAEHDLARHPDRLRDDDGFKRAD